MTIPENAQAETEQRPIDDKNIGTTRLVLVRQRPSVKKRLASLLYTWGGMSIPLGVIIVYEYIRHFSMFARIRDADYLSYIPDYIAMLHNYTLQVIHAI